MKGKLKAEMTRFWAWFMTSMLRPVMNMASGKAGDWIGLLITMMIGVVLIPIVVDQVQNTNTTSWIFTGSSGAKTLFLLLPFIFIVGLIVYFIGRLLGKI